MGLRTVLVLLSHHGGQSRVPSRARGPEPCRWGSATENPHASVAEDESDGLTYSGRPGKISGSHVCGARMQQRGCYLRINLHSGGPQRRWRLRDAVPAGCAAAGMSPQAQLIASSPHLGHGSSVRWGRLARATCAPWQTAGVGTRLASHHGRGCWAPTSTHHLPSPPQGRGADVQETWQEHIPQEGLDYLPNPGAQ